MRRVLASALASCFVAALAPRGAAQFVPVKPVSAVCSDFQELSYAGMYSSKASYPTGGQLAIHGNWPEETVKYRLLRIGPAGSDPHGFTFVHTINDTNPEPFGAEQLPAFGSFVEFPLADLSGGAAASTTRLTIEGWVRPTYVWPANHPGGNEPEKVGGVIVAGQVEWTASGFRGAGIGILANGSPFAVVSLADTGNPSTTTTLFVNDRRRFCRRRSGPTSL